MQASIAHEVPDQLTQRGVDAVWHLDVAVARVVGLIEHREGDPPSVADCPTELHGHQVSTGDVGEPLPGPLARSRVDDLDAVRQRALDAVSALGHDAARGLLAVDEELRRGTCALVGGDLDVEVLPRVAVHVAEFPEPQQAAVGRHQGVADEASRRREHGGLRVAPAVALTELVALRPLLRGGGEAGRGRCRACERAASLAAACLRMTRACAVALRAYPSYGPTIAGQLRRAAVGGGRHQRRDRPGESPTAVGVVGVTRRHQQCAQVRVADAQLTVGPGVHPDRLGREVGEADRDVHRGDDQLDRFHELLGVEGVVVLQELQQVQRRQVA